MMRQWIRRRVKCARAQRTSGRLDCGAPAYLWRLPKPAIFGITGEVRFSYVYVDILPGDRDAVPSVDTQLLQAGYRYALSLTHHRQNAEDLIQDAWLKLCRRYGGVGSQAALFTTIRHLYIDQCRRAHVIAFEVLDNDAHESPTVPQILPGTTQDLQMLLGALRPAEREAIFLHHVHGHTAEEIAVLTAQPRGTVLSLLHRALEKLRRAVSPPTVQSGEINGNIAIIARLRSSMSDTP